MVPYHRIILDSVIKRYRLPEPRLGVSYSHPPFIAKVTVRIETRGGPSYHEFLSNPCNVRAKAEDQACQKAIAGLEAMNYKRLHYKNELNNIIVNGSRNQRTLGFYRTQSGPQHQRVHTSTVMIDGDVCQGYTATSTSEIHADDLACKMYLEAIYPAYRY
ncbi:hypothetical protein E4T56_gene16118 [Termitomyces sp. T112]|nr:hypothetical protein E4T56_gene16118 [Termitomyces sp. T112]